MRLLLKFSAKVAYISCLLKLPYIYISHADIAEQKFNVPVTVLIQTLISMTSILSLRLGSTVSCTYNLFTTCNNSVGIAGNEKTITTTKTTTGSIIWWSVSKSWGQRYPAYTYPPQFLHVWNSNFIQCMKGCACADSHYNTYWVRALCDPYLHAMVNICST